MKNKKGQVLEITGVALALIGLLGNKYFLTFIGIALLIIALIPGLLGGFITSLFIKIPWYVYGLGLLLLIFVVTKKK